MCGGMGRGEGEGEGVGGWEWEMVVGLAGIVLYITWKLSEDIGNDACRVLLT